MNQYLRATPILDFDNAAIQQLIDANDWRRLSRYDAIGAVYDYVKDRVLFGYNSADDLAASQVLANGYGQCNTKASLLMALLRALGIPCRIHGFTIYNALQQGAIPNWLMWLAPDRIIHSWVEVEHEGTWLNLEGFIIDHDYLISIQTAFADDAEQFSGYGIATTCLSKPPVEWRGGNTYIQSEGIADDFGVFDCPDDFYRRIGSNLSGLKKLAFSIVIRHLMNRNVDRIRQKGLIRRGTAMDSQAHIGK